MHDKNIATGTARIVSAITVLVLLMGLSAYAPAAETPATTADPDEVNVEVFEGPHILTAPTSNSYPKSEERSGREGWVLINMMIDPKGKPYEAMAVDSSGSKAMEEAAIKALDQMTFAPGRKGDKPVDSSFMFKMIFYLSEPATGTDSYYVQNYQQLVAAIQKGDKEKADAQLARIAGQNLYEQAFTAYAKYFYDTKWGTPADQLRDLNLAIAGEGRPKYLPKEAFASALMAKFTLQARGKDYGGALATWKSLEPIAPAAQRTDFENVVRQIRALQVTNKPVVTTNTIDGTTDWRGKLFRNQFSLDVKSGSVSEIKLLCPAKYLFFKYEPGVTYTIESSSGRCYIEVIGNPGTVFDLVQ